MPTTAPACLTVSRARSLLLLLLLLLSLLAAAAASRAPLPPPPLLLPMIALFSSQVKPRVVVSYVVCLDTKDGYDSDATFDDDDYYFVSQMDVAKSQRLAEILHDFGFKDVSSLPRLNGPKSMLGEAKFLYFCETLTVTPKIFE